MDVIDLGFSDRIGVGMKGFSRFVRGMKELEGEEKMRTIEKSESKGGKGRERKLSKGGSC